MGSPDSLVNTQPKSVLQGHKCACRPLHAQRCWASGSAAFFCFRSHIPQRGWRRDAAQQTSRAVSTSAFLGLQKVFKFGSGLQKRSEQTELLEQLLSETPEQDRLDELLDQLIASPAPFQASALSGGPWQVVYTRGPLLWQKLTQSGSSLSGRRSKKVAFQDFRSEDSSVVNYGELTGPQLYVTAEGTYKILSDNRRTPVEIEANISGGALHCFGKRLPLPIKGTGLVSLVYTDGQNVRVFKNGTGGLSVQVKQSLL